MGKQKRILVTGAGGFIGHHLVNRLKSDGHWVRGLDIKYPEYQPTAKAAGAADAAAWVMSAVPIFPLR